MEITDQVLLFIIMGLLGFILVELYTLRTMAKFGRIWSWMQRRGGTYSG